MRISNAISGDYQTRSGSSNAHTNFKDKFYVVIWFLIPLVVYKFLVPKDMKYIGEHPDRDPQLLLWETTELDQDQTCHNVITSIIMFITLWSDLSILPKITLHHITNL